MYVVVDREGGYVAGVITTTPPCRRVGIVYPLPCEYLLCIEDIVVGYGMKILR